LNPPAYLDEGKDNQKKWQLLPLVLLLLVILLLCGFLGLLTPHWLNVDKSFEPIPFNLHPVEQANYQVDTDPPTIIGVSLAILADILRDLDPKAGDIDERVKAALEQLDLPVPMATALVPGGIAALSSPAASKLMPFMAVPAAASPAPTQAPPISAAPTSAIKSPPPPPPAFVAPKEPEKPEEPKENPFIPPLPPVSVFPFPTPTPSPSPTSTPTETLTSTSTSTPTETPTSTLTSTQTSTPTETPTLTLTSTPTATPTSTATSAPPGCSLPKMGTGYVASVSPENGSKGVPVDVNIVIQFNQAMQASSLTYGDNNHFILCRTADANCKSADTVGATLIVANNPYTNDKVIIIPSVALDNNHTYYLTIGSSVKNACGWWQIVSYRVSFTTIP